MPGVNIRDGESFDQLLKRFKKQCEKAGVLADVRKKEHFEKPSINCLIGSIFLASKVLSYKLQRFFPVLNGSF